MEAQNKVIEKYEIFINDVLKEDLKKVLKERSSVQNKLDDCVNLQKLIKHLQDEELPNATLKVKVDLGCNFYTEAVVPECKRIFVHIGFGLYLEYTLDEATNFLKKRILQYKSDLEELAKTSAKIKAHIKMMIEILYRKEFS